MKYAIISDVHGNMSALDAVLNDAKSADVNKFIFVGDYYMCFPFPNEVINKIKNLPNSYVVRGNEEDRIERLSGQNQATWTDGQFNALYWYYRNINEENRNYLIDLPSKLQICDTNMTINVTHSSAEFIGNIEMREFSPSKISKNFIDRLPTKEELQNIIFSTLNGNKIFHNKLDELTDGIYIFGHSHIQWHSTFEKKILVNPGSCGFPLDFAHGAPYTLLEISDNNVSIEERRIKYNESQAVSDLLESDLYECEKVWNEIIIKEFELGKDILISFLSFAEEYANKKNDSVRPFSKETWKEAYNRWKEINSNYV
jgi:predicted phosphodiesterase